MMQFVAWVSATPKNLMLTISAIVLVAGSLMGFKLRTVFVLLGWMVAASMFSIPHYIYYPGVIFSMLWSQTAM